MAAPYAELHCHTNFSFLDGASSADDLVEQAASLGLSALAVTDHQGLYGAVRFASAAEEVGLHAVVGMEIELLDAAVPDPHYIVVPARRRRPRGSAAGRATWGAAPGPPSAVPLGRQQAADSLHAGPSTRAGETRPPPAAEWPEPSTGGGEVVVGGRPVSPGMERKRPPGHREARREDLRGVRPRELGPHLVLLAQDGTGYSSLCRIASAAHLAGTKGVPRFTHELLEKHAGGLIALTGCRHGEIARRLLAGDREGAAACARRLAAVFGAGSLFVELQHHLLPDDDWLVAELVRLAREVELPTVVTNGAHYALPEDRELQDVLVCIRHGLTLDESDYLRRPNGEYHLKSEEELRALPPGTPDADPAVRAAWEEGIAAAGEIAARCTVELGFEKYRFPGFPVPRGETPYSYLETLCHDGARRRYQPMTSKVVKQLAHELDVIERTGLAEFFLICWDLMRFCKERGIPAQGRGSAGDSVVAYVLGITRVDPIRHRLLFERFINEGRTTYPDVDIDFASSRREEVIQYVYELYGTEHTGMVCNVVTYRARSAVREVGYALGFPRPLVDRVAKALETYDSVMVRRDLEAEGGFAEFFQEPSDADGDRAMGPGAGSSPAAGGSLPQAVAAAATTEASRIASERASTMDFVDGMGELAHPRKPRPEPGDDAGTRALGAQPARSAPAKETAGRWKTAREDEQRAEGGTVIPLHDRLHPRTELRPGGPSDDEGGPGDTPVSVRWLRAEAEWKRIGRGGSAPRDIGPTSGTTAGITAGSDEPISQRPRTSAPGDRSLLLITDGLDRPMADDGHPAGASRSHIGAGSTGDRDGSTPLDRTKQRTDATRHPEEARSGRGTVSAITRTDQTPDDYRPPALRRGTVEGRIIDPGTGVLLSAPRSIDLHARGDASAADGSGAEHTRRVDRAHRLAAPDERTRLGSASLRSPASRAGRAHACRLAAPASYAALAQRRVKETSLGALELDPLPHLPPSRSTIGMSPWDRWLELCARIDGFPRHLSIHVGGMLITAAPLVDIAPLERATMPGRVVVQYDKRDVETIKLIKLDLLGLRMLSAIDDALRDISVDCAVHVDLDRLPEDIPEVFRMIQAADTVGVFQIESRAQMQTLPKSRPETLDDLVVEVAIIRPGPIQGNAVHPYLRRRQGLEPVTYLHPSLQPALEETMGVILYQEQVMKVAIDVAGFSAAESDGFRRAMGTWRSSREMEKLHARFVDGCVERSGLTGEQAEELFRQVAAFASFGFNKSHAAAFARTAYESSFLKLFYPAQFVAGLINAQPMGFYPVEVLINDAKRHGVPVLPVDVDRSRYRTTTEWAGMPDEPLPEGAGIDRRPPIVGSPSCVVPDQSARDRFAAPTAIGYGIRLGLHLVKGIGEAEGEALDAELARGGPYRSLADIVARTGLSEEIVERLIRAGALDSLGHPRRELLWQLREVAGATRGRYDGRTIGSRKAQGRPLDLRLPPTPAPDLPPPSELERLGDSYAILSLDARRQVVELFRPALDRLGVLTVSRLDEHPPGRVRIGGLVVTRQHPMTARGTVFLALEDETGMVNVTLWPDTWARLRGVVRRHALLYVEGELQREERVVNLVANRIRPLTEVARSVGGPDRAEGVRQLGHAGMRRLG